MKKRAYIRCRIACSTPPMYWSTGIQRASDLRVPRRLVVVGVGVAQEVPGRVDEGVHRVRLAPRGAAARRAAHVDPVLGRGQRRAALAARSPRRRAARPGSWSSGTGHDPAALAVDDRDRAAPVALAREQPVAQAVVDRRVALALAIQPGDDPLQRLAVGQPVEVGVGVHQRAVAGVGLGLDVLAAARRPRGSAGRTCARTRGRARRGRDGHDRARPVLHQHVVGDVHRAGARR